MNDQTDERLPDAPLGVAAVVRRAGPRLVRDGFGPLATFFVAWKLVGLVAGIGAATLFGLVVFVHERRAGRPAMVVRLALVLVTIRAIVGLTSQNATVYLGQEVAIDTLLGSAVLASLATRRPFASLFALEVYPFTPDMLGSQTFRGAMRRITVVWGAYFLARAVVRLAALLTLPTDRYLLVAALSDAPFLVALLAWSVFHTLHAFRRSQRWGHLLAAGAADSAASVSASG
ncbi:MAG: hypothetical protein E6G56_10075 [Actinobacteria bacterium]|nr:MAG: hypothetical protein E6G56_10075 [Actinomycetota bacterium]